jgi:hypothetical protein
MRQKVFHRLRENANRREIHRDTESQKKGKKKRKRKRERKY